MTTREEELAKRAASHKGFKSHLTFALNTAERVIGSARTGGPSQHMLDELKTCNKKLQLALGKVEASIREMQTLDRPETFEAYEEKLREEHKRTNNYLAGIDKFIIDIETALKMPAPTVAAPRAGGAPPPKPNSALKPKELTRDNTPIEFAAWIEQFRAYFVSSRMAQASLMEQQAYFKNCIGAYLLSRIQSKIQVNTPILPDPAGTDLSCIELLREEFLVQYPLFTRRLDFFQYKQASGQHFTDWETTLRKKGDEADLAALSVDDLYVMRYLTGITDSKLQVEFLKESNPDSKKLKDLAQTYEMAKRYVKAMGPSTSNVKSKDKQQPSKGKQGKGSSTQTQTPHFARQLASEGKCLRCGKKREEGHQCKALEWECRTCGKVGHFPSVCFSKQNTKSNNVSSKPDAKGKSKSKSKTKANVAQAKRNESSESDTSDEEAVTNTVRT